MKLLALLALTAVAHAVTPPAQITVPPGFRVELLREAGPRDGSWISMTRDDKGRLYISPQGAIPESSFAKDSKWGGLWRVTVQSQKSPVADPALPTAHLPLLTTWEKVPVPIGDSMGMLWAFDSLYVSGEGPEGRGIYRCKDTDGDSMPDTAALWKSIPGGAGEHGAHALVLGPDKKSIYIINGNSTPILDGLSPDSPYRAWGEDDLLPRLRDPVATFFDKIRAPYGCLYRTDEHGEKWELLAGGMRNAYDIAFNADGELFTYDSDMEWERGLPWYRPTRVLHLVPGGEYGFREGSAKWPAYYPDSLPPVCDIGVGCPTGVAFGTASSFPEKYKRAFFICDWTYGRILAVHMQEKGASYTAAHALRSYTFPKDAESGGDVETFLSGKGLPVTDMEFLDDGSMVFTTGGRGTAAALYRVSWVGEGAGKIAKAAPTPLPASGAIAELDQGVTVAERMARMMGAPSSRRKDFYNVLTFGTKYGMTNPTEYIRILNDALVSKDSWLQFAAITGLDLHDAKWGKHPELGSSFLPMAKTPMSAIALPGLLGWTRQGVPAGQSLILERLKSFPLAALTGEEKLLKLRILQLSFARQGRPSEEWQKVGIEKLLGSYPATGPEAAKLNRELCQLLIWLSNPELGDVAQAAGLREVQGKSEAARDGGVPPQAGSLRHFEAAPNPGAKVFPGRKGAAFHAELGREVIERTLGLMEAAQSQEEQIQFALYLRWAHGWTPEQRERYFRWFHEKAARYRGGNSFAKFVEAIRADAWSRVPEQERAALSRWDRPVASASAPPAPKPRDFVKAWTLPELEAALDELKERKPDIERGRALYAGAGCAQCHLFKDEGGAVGPDLSAVAQRFGRRDVIEACVEPGKVVSDQYAMVTLTVVKFGGGGTEEVSGLVLEDTSATITLLTDPLTGRTANYYKNVVRKREKAAVSIMPPGLLNTCTAEEVADLLAFMGVK